LPKKPHHRITNTKQKHGQSHDHERKAIILLWGGHVSDQPANQTRFPKRPHPL